MTKHTGIVTIDDIAEMLRLTSWEALFENSICFIGQECFSEDEEEQQKREEAEVASLYSQWYCAVMHVANLLFGEHGLEFKGRKADGENPYRLYVRAKCRDWEHAASKLIDTINGEGMFYFSGVKHLVESGPYGTVRNAVLHHLHWARYRPLVYGNYSAAHMFNQAFR